MAIVHAWLIALHELPFFDVVTSLLQLFFEQLLCSEWFIIPRLHYIAPASRVPLLAAQLRAFAPYERYKS